jgi:TadE-like protein
MQSPAKRNTFWRFTTGRSGAVTIEFVVTIPLFLAALAFSFEFGQLFLAHQSTVNNVRSAARYLARTDLTTGDFNRANSIIRTGRIDGTGTPPDYIAGECLTPFACAEADPDDSEIHVRVRVEYPLRLFSFIDPDPDRPTTIPFVIREDVRWVGM